MKKLISLALALGVCMLVYGQKTKNLVVSGNTYNIVEKGIQYADQGKFKEALAEYAKVPFGDPEYENAQYEIALVQSESGDYRGAVQTLEKLLSKPIQNVRMNLPYILLGSCYDELGLPQKALDAYNQVLVRYPYSYLAHFNKGVTLYGMERYEEAQRCFKKSIWLYPAHTTSHYYYSMCNLRLGYTVPAILGLNYTVLLNHTSQVAIRALQELDELYESGVSLYNQEHNVEISDEIESLNEFYAPIILKINTKYAESKKFKCSSKIKHEVVRANQMVFEEVIIRPNSHSIENVLYVPFFKTIMKQKGGYNLLTYYQFAETDVDNGKVSAKAAKMQGQFQTLVEVLVAQLREIAPRGLGIDNPGDNAYVYSKRLTLNAWGPNMQVPGDNQEIHPDGIWMVVGDGQLQEIDYYSNGELNGLCASYQDNELARELPFVNGIVNGTARNYYTNPYTHQRVLSSTAEVVNGEENGLYQEYNKAGILVAEAVIKGGSIDGDIKAFDDYGNKWYVLSQDPDGNSTGVYYWPNGQLKIKSEKEGQNVHHVSFYTNGVKSQEYYTHDDAVIGDKIHYYKNGKIQTIERYDDKGQFDGLSVSYNRDGKLSSSAEWAQGKQIRIVEYDAEGKPLLVLEGKNGELVSAAALNADSSVRESFSMKNGKMTVNIYSHYGYLNSTITYNSKWEMNGPATSYYPNGQIKKSCNYKNDLLEGTYQEYYDNGRQKLYANYEKGMLNGPRVSYLNNSENSVEEESFCHNDTITGASYSYFPDGNLEFLFCYDQDGVITYQGCYLPDGKLKDETFYYGGLPYVSKHFDRDGQVLHSDTLYNGTGVYKSYFVNGRLKHELPMVCGGMHGVARYYDVNGNLLDTISYLANEANGTVFNRDWDGSVVAETNYVLGKKEGIMRVFNLEGVKIAEQYFENDLGQGMFKWYSDNGVLDVETPFNEDERVGHSVYFAPDGKTVLFERIREHNELVAIATMQQDGKLSEPVPVSSGEQKFTSYYPSGKTSCVYSLNNGCGDGVMSKYYPTGQAFSIQKLKAGLLDGTSISYYPNGNVQSECVYKDDCLHGKYKRYYDNGQVRVEGNYYYDQPHGEFKKYDKTGKLVRKVILVYGSTVLDESYE